MQTKLASIATNNVNTSFNTDILIKKVDLSFLGSISLKGVEIRDHHKDTLIFIDKLSTSLLNVKRVLENEVQLSSISLSGVQFHLKTYANETNDNLNIFVEKLEDDTPRDPNTGPFTLTSSNIYLEDLTFKQINENDATPFAFGVTQGGGNLQNFSIIGPDVSAKIRGLYFVDNRGLAITSLSTDFVYTTSQMQFYNTRLQTKHSDVYGTIQFDYKRENLKYFNDSVAVKATFKESTVAIQDLKKLYTELSGSDLLHIDGGVVGVLNNFSTQHLKVFSDEGLKADGEFRFTNAVNTDKGFVFEGDFSDITANYELLKKDLPNLLGEHLPSEFKRLGNFTLRGTTRITASEINALLDINSEIGSAFADLKINNADNIDDVTYKGQIEFYDFNIGSFFNDPKFGILNFKGDVVGSGFKIENINTSIIGNVSSFEFNEYNYKNIGVNGQYKKKLFNGSLAINDEFLKMTFDGLADFSSEESEFDFNASIALIDLNKTNLFTRDSIAILKGSVDFDIRGNTIDNVIGLANFKNVTYTNQKQTYTFDTFRLASALREDIKTIIVDSKDIVKGELSGNFTFDELWLVAKNALGSMYSNYKPHKVAPHQYVDFNFSIYNQIVDVFFPEVFIDKNTTIKGSIQGDDNRVKLTVSSPKIVAYGNEVNDLVLRTDNVNPLYNTHITAKDLSTAYYRLSKLNLLNRTQNDTLFFKSVFRGGKQDNEQFNMDFYFTINKDKKSVVGIQKSTFNFKENNWNVNPENNKDNKITFDLKTQEFKFEPFELVSNAQRIKFNGVVRDSTFRDLKADFTQVSLQSFLPEIDSLSLKGLLNGNVSFFQDGSTFQPEGNLFVNDFEINDYAQGDLALNIKGKDSYTNYAVALSLTKEREKSIAATGTLDFTTAQPSIDLQVYLQKLKLNAFSPLGEDVLSRIRGEATGQFSLQGPLVNPEMDGRITLRNAGLKFPYLNTDYDFEGETQIGLIGQSFDIEKLVLKDTKHNTRANLVGSIVHQNFDAWFLDLRIDTNNLLILDTQNSEESLYYGTGFINGTAEITGLTNRLTIDLNGKTEKGTLFVIPVKDIATVDNYKLIHFKSDKVAEERQKELALEALEGLTLNINLEVTKDAVAQVVIDEVNGSDLKGSGSGDLQIEINTLGKFNMFGDFTIDNGFYNLKYGGLINKPFAILKGGTVSWNGSPFDANLDVTAVYTTNANPSLLLENFNTSRKIPVNLITKISGGLFNSKQEFDIEIPNTNSTIASELDFVLNDNDVNAKMRQFFSLLAFGSFVNPDRVNFDSNELLTGTTSNLIGTVLSDLISSKDGKIQLGLDYISGNQPNNVDNLNIDNRVDVSVNTQISDRVVINGKVGVPVGTQTQSSVVGEVKVEVLLNEKGNFRGIIFNRQNEIQYSTQEEGYTQGVGLSYQVNFNTLSDLLKQLGLKNKQPKKKNVSQDSVLTKHKQLLNFKKSKEL